QRRHVEGRRQPRLPLREQVPEALVRLLGRAEARELPHRPQPAPVHGRVHAARERELTRKAEIAPVVDRDVVRRVQRLQLDPRDRREQLVLALRRPAVPLPAPLGGRIELAPILGRRHAMDSRGRGARYRWRRACQASAAASVAAETPSCTPISWDGLPCSAANSASCAASTATSQIAKRERPSERKWYR